MSTSSSASNASQHSRPDGPSSIALDTLLPYLIASKRSLSTIEHVYRANDICTATRLAAEKSATIQARTSYLTAGLLSQVTVLDDVQRRTNQAEQLARAEHESVVNSLDAAERRLRHTLRGLKETIVEAKLRPEGEEKRCLLDFVDETGVEGLVAGIREDVKKTQQKFQEFELENTNFQGDLRSVGDVLYQTTRPGQSQSLDTQGLEPISETLADMEEHAKEMAVNLESLVSHFDLCVTAIKHTEGGGDAAIKIAEGLPEGVDVGQETKNAPPEPMSDEQRIEMMRVLDEDAGQVDDVVMEIKSNIAEMESMYRQVESHMDQSRRLRSNADLAFKRLEALGRGLPKHVTRNQTFLVEWNDQKTRIEDRLEELDNAKGFYDGFLKAYDNLIIEIGRRKSIEAKVDKVIHEATSKLHKLYQDDMNEREAFKHEQGEFIPVDLWPSLLNAPNRFDIVPVNGTIEKAPDISSSIIHKAIRRIHGQG